MLSILSETNRLGKQVMEVASFLQHSNLSRKCVKVSLFTLGGLGVFYALSKFSNKSWLQGSLSTVASGACFAAGYHAHLKDHKITELYDLLEKVVEKHGLEDNFETLEENLKHLFDLITLRAQEELEKLFIKKEDFKSGDSPIGKLFADYVKYISSPKLRGKRSSLFKLAVTSKKNYPPLYECLSEDPVLSKELIVEGVDSARTHVAIKDLRKLFEKAGLAKEKLVGFSDVAFLKMSEIHRMIRVWKRAAIA